MKNLFSALIFLTLVFSGCASSPLKGLDAQGKKIYLGTVPIENTDAYKEFVDSRQTEVDKQNYIFKRFKTPEAQKLSYFHDGTWYSWLDAYRGGMWLIRNRYKKGTDARSFIQEHVRYSEDTGKAHLVKYPDGTIQEGYYVLLNELDLLEAAVGKKA